MKVFPRCAPVLGSFDLDRAQKEDPHIAAGEGRSLANQALMQLLGNSNIKTHLCVYQTIYIEALGMTLVVSIVLGLITGTLMSFSRLCDSLANDQLFEVILVSDWSIKYSALLSLVNQS